jgi:thiol:disulfide interchange protein DsbD
VGARLAIFLSALGLFLVAVNAAPEHQQILLEPDEAFAFSARLVSNDALEVSYRIAEGYYLYRDRFSFRAERDALRLGRPEFPPGEWHSDEFFGRSEIYRRQVTIRIPLETPLAGLGFTLVAVSQGCADVGVCYLPATHRLRLPAGQRSLELPKP